MDHKKALSIKKQMFNMLNPPKDKVSGLAIFQEHKKWVEGHVTISKIFPDGREEKVVASNNMVVEQADTIMPFMSAGLKFIHYMELGDPSPVTPPALEDTTLQQTTGERKVITFTGTGNQAIYEANWLTSEGNGNTYTEVGLFTNPLGTGTMFARKSFSPIVKTNSFGMKITWVLVFKLNTGVGSDCSGVALLGASTINADYEYIAAGGESQLVVPLDFAIGAKQLDVYLNSGRLPYTTSFIEVPIGGSRGIQFVGFTLNAGDQIYIMNRKLA